MWAVKTTNTPAMAEQPQSPSNEQGSPPFGALVVGLIAAVVIIAGSLGPWVTLGIISVSGTTGGDAVLC